MVATRSRSAYLRCGHIQGRPSILGDGQKHHVEVGWIAATPAIGDVAGFVGEAVLLLEDDPRPSFRQHFRAERQDTEDMPIGGEHSVGDQEAGADMAAALGFDAADGADQWSHPGFEPLHRSLSSARLRF